MPHSVLIEPQRLRSAPRLRLVCDDRGGWTLASGDGIAHRFDDFDAALDIARQGCAAKPATIEVWQGDHDICCVAPAAERRVVPRGARPQGRIECWAHAAARVLMTTAGPLFWLALVATTVAASLGWRGFLL